MKMSDIPFTKVDWSEIAASALNGDKGVAIRRTVQLGDIRVRMVEYSPGYVSDHWCEKGHILLVLEGTLETVLKDGRKFTLTPGTSYQVADGAEPHRSSTATGVKLFIVD